jgi:hypothetical protein
MGKINLKPYFFLSKKSLPKGTQIIDAFQRSLEELFFIENPRFKKEMPENKKVLAQYLKKTKIKGVWIYFPWRKASVFTVPENIFFTLRTARNHDIITEKEQLAFRNSSIGIVGLSVGSVILSALVANGGPKNIRLADFDEVEITNLNRMKGTVLDIGKNKTEVAAINVWELDPFAQLDLWKKGVSQGDLKQFLTKKPKLDLFIDTMDSLDLKILARLICRDLKIPVVMITENGDNSIIDVERYDLEKNLQLFHGRIGKVSMNDFKNLDYRQWLKLAAKIVGAAFLTPRMQESILKLGKTIASVPQLSTSVAIGGASSTAIIRRILNRQPLASGRYLINVDEKIVPFYNSLNEIKKRKQKTKIFLNLLE